ncbi:alkaline-shock protein [Enterococcus pallens]|nr:alkaline-shock protein [Enterococcus pallens]
MGECAYLRRLTTMAVKINTQTGMIEISNEVIATVVGGAVTDVFGIVGMASKNQIKDNITEILRKENYSRGVVVRQEENGIAVDVYTIVSYGTKISEVSRNVQEKVKYNLETLLGVKANSVNVFVQGVRVLPD